MMKFGALLAVGLLLPVVAVAQGGKMSGTVVCDAPAQETAIPVAGRPDHAYAVSQVKCTWTKPWQVAGVAAKDGVGTGMAQISGNSSQSSGTFVDTMANGDKAFYKYEFSATLKAGKPEKVSNHKWELIGGTGKMAAIKGKGTCNVTPQAEGRFVYECQGDYQ
jgi:hypothetical protein